MRTSIKLIGKRWDMKPRRNRRLLVSLIYGLYAAFLVMAWIGGRSERPGFLLAALFPIYASQILGGSSSSAVTLFGEGGLIESFDGRRGLKYPEKSGRPYLSSLLHPEIDDDPGLRQDERTAERHAKAGAGAFGHVSLLVMAAFWVQFLASSSLWPQISPAIADSLTRLALQICYLFVFTEPAAILLWSEPDMEEPHEG